MNVCSNMAKTKLVTKKQKAPAWYIAKEVMKKKGYTYESLAPLIGLSRTSTFEVINYPPNIMHCKAIADALHVPFSKLFDFKRKEETDDAVDDSES